MSNRHNILHWLVTYLCVKRPAIKVTTAPAAAIDPKSKDRCHILYRRWYTANANGVSAYSSMRKECPTRSLEMDTLSHAVWVKKVEVEVVQIEEQTREIQIHNRIGVSLPQSPYWGERPEPLHDNESSWYACCLLLIVLVSFVDCFCRQTKQWGRPLEIER
jgi:hypothetical protein